MKSSPRHPSWEWALGLDYLNWGPGLVAMDKGLSVLICKME